MRKIETFEQFREALAKPLPAIECRPFRRQPELAVICRAYTLGQAINWRENPPYLGYGPDGLSVVAKPERWDDILLRNLVFWPEMIRSPQWEQVLSDPNRDTNEVESMLLDARPHPHAGQPVFQDQRGRRLWYELSQNSLGVIQTLVNHCHAASGLFLEGQWETGPGPSETLEPAGSEDDGLLESLLNAYSSKSSHWVSNIIPQDREAALHVGPYGLDDWAAAQTAAAKRWGYEQIFGFPSLLWASLQDRGGAPLVPDDPEVRAEMVNLIPFGTAHRVADLAAQFSEVGELPLDFFGPPPGEPLPAGSTSV